MIKIPYCNNSNKNIKYVLFTIQLSVIINTNCFKIIITQECFFSGTVIYILG